MKHAFKYTIRVEAEKPFVSFTLESSYQAESEKDVRLWIKKHYPTSNVLSITKY